MEDCCAVCADSLEWIAYGPCGHRDVCSTCVIRLRFVLSDSRCCICKTECHTVFITRAMGSFTEAKVNFSDFPPGASEGQHGNSWYHEDSQAFFDDADHYRMISAMCKLSCGICDNTTEELHRGNNYRKFRYKNIAQLKGHLYHQHRKFMCNLCLEGRKTFISEQKLYSRSQLRQHVSTGDSEVDGSESERGGFAGHPMCEFCKNPFYGDAELYMHMSREHFTCHICQRQHPGQYDYYRNYEDLETHFRQEHFLCENENCLTKKFIVFLTDAEMKRHNAIEHGGHMSRAKRNAALQIPVSFRYRRNEQDHRQGRSRDLHPEASINQLTMAIQASLETAFSEGRLNTEHGEANQTDEITGSMETLAITSHPGVDGSIIQETSFPPLSDLEQLLPSSRYAQALNKWSASHLGEESFPPLHGVKESSKPKPALFSDGADTIAARINPRNKGTVKVLHSAQPRPVKNYEAGSYTSSTIRPAQNSQKAPSPSSARPWGASSQVTQIGENCVAATIPAESAWNQKSTMIKHSSSAPNLCNSDPSGLEATSNQEILPAGNVQRANKSLVDRIRADLGNDENKYTIFKSISAEYRQGSINSWEYISYAEQFNISHLVPELAQLCPDLQKQRELLDVYNAVQRAKGMRENSGNAANLKKEAKKGKGKVKEKEENFTVKHALADNILEQVRKLQGSRYPSEEDQLEILSKDGYRANSGSKIPSTVEVGSASSSSNLNSMGHEGLKKNKKTSKFIRERLGDGSSSAFLDHLQQRSPKKIYEEDRSKPSNVLPVQGVWGRGGGQKLFAQNGATK